MIGNGRDGAAEAALADAAHPPAAEVEATEPPPAATGREGSVGPLAVLTDGLGQVTRASGLLRGASLYIGLLFAALAGAGIVAELGFASWATDFRPSSAFSLRTAIEAGDRATAILLVGAACCLAVVIDGNAIGMTLLAGRVLGTEVTLQAAIARARQVFWRLLGAGIILGVVQLVASAIYRVIFRVPPVTGPGGLPVYSVEPIPAFLVSLPFILATGSIVLADDGIRAALRRSFRLLRGARRLAVALALFALVSGVIQGVAFLSGFDLVMRVTTALELDVTAGTTSYVASALLGVTIVMALGSLVFTMAALVAAPQVIALIRLGIPLDGLGRVVAGPGASLAPPTATPAAPPPAAPPPEQPTAEPEPPATSADPAVASSPEPAATPTVFPGLPPDAPRPPRIRLMTIPMRLVSIALWTIAVVSVLVGPPS